MIKQKDKTQVWALANNALTNQPFYTKVCAINPKPKRFLTKIIAFFLKKIY